MINIFIKFITIATLFYVAFFLYFDVKNLKEMFNIACRLRKERNLSVYITLYACLTTKQFWMLFLSFMLNLFCVILLIITLFM